MHGKSSVEILLTLKYFDDVKIDILRHELNNAD